MHLSPSSKLGYLSFNGSEQKKSMHYFTPAKRSVRGTCFDSKSS